MVQNRAAGNGNFDIDAITRLANADVNAPAVIDQPRVDPVADAFAADVDDMVDELRFNPSSNLAEEAQQIMNSPLAAKLGAGVVADLRAAVQLQEEKAANGADAFMRGGEAWEERKERDEKDRKEQARIADMADDANNASQSMTPQQWDEAPSSEFPGMTNAEALAAIKRINANLPFYSQLAVQKGWIKEEEKPDFERAMILRQKIMEDKRAGRKPDPELQQEYEALPSHIKNAATKTVTYANERGVENTNAAPISGAKAGEVGSTARDSATAAYAVDADEGAKPPPEHPSTVSVAKSLDLREGSSTDQPTITTTFNASAYGAVTPMQAPAAAPVAPAQPVRVASANFDQSAGMI